MQQINTTDAVLRMYKNRKCKYILWFPLLKLSHYVYLQGVGKMIQ